MRKQFSNESIKPMKTSLLIRFALFLMLAPLPLVAQTGHTSWGPWSFDWEVKDGAAIGLRNVYYNGEKVIHRANLPTIRVHYDGGTTYADRIWWDDLVTEVDMCGKKFGCGTKVCQRSYVLNGRTWLEIGVFIYLGEYRLYPCWTLSTDGY